MRQAPGPVVFICGVDRPHPRGAVVQPGENKRASISRCDMMHVVCWPLEKNIPTPTPRQQSGPPDGDKCLLRMVDMPIVYLCCNEVHFQGVLGHALLKSNSYACNLSPQPQNERDVLISPPPCSVEIWIAHWAKVNEHWPLGVFFFRPICFVTLHQIMAIHYLFLSTATMRN